MSPAASMIDPPAVIWERTTADPPERNAAFARGWYANQPKDAAPAGVKSPIATVIMPAAATAAAPSQASIVVFF